MQFHLRYDQNQPVSLFRKKIAGKCLFTPPKHSCVFVVFPEKKHGEMMGNDLQTIQTIHVSMVSMAILL